MPHQMRPMAEPPPSIFFSAAIPALHFQVVLILISNPSNATDMNGKIFRDNH
jgi:hypothetical protein